MMSALLETKIMNVSTGDPSGRWKPWIRWIRVIVVMLAGAWFVQFSEKNLAVIFAWVGVLAVLIYRLRVSEQRFDFLIDQQPVQITLYADKSRRTWIEVSSRSGTVRSCLLEAYCTGWIDYEIALDTKRFQLRILVKPIGAGYLISNYGREFDMVVLNNTC